MNSLGVSSRLLESDYHKVESLYLIMPAVESLWADACQALESYHGISWPLYKSDNRELEIFDSKMQEWNQKLYYSIRSIDIAIHHDIYVRYLNLMSSLVDYNLMCGDACVFLKKKEEITISLQMLTAVVNETYSRLTSSKAYLDSIPFQL